MQTSEWIIAGATLLGPILAVQAQKAIERSRERNNRKSWVFHTLMATRAARVSADHVQALNMIDLVFYGQRILSIHRRSKAEQNVVDAWREYHDHLGIKADEKTLQLWHVKGDELFVNLLFAMAEDVGYKFDRVQLKKGAYSPVAHGDLEYEESMLRKHALRVLSGEVPVKMAVSSFPVDEEAMKAQVELQRRLGDALAGRGVLAVEVREEKNNKHNENMEQSR